MKLAIVIGVSKYTHATPLPACENDAYIVNEIISSSGKFDAILYLSENTSSTSVKSSLSKFIAEYTDKEVEELLFYFSGHGMFTNQEFHYALSDFDINKLKQTSLENSELDQLIRSLSPSLTVKVVDACQSGVDYIKNGDVELRKSLQLKAQSFKNCYFMYSSNSDQSSFASSTISHFTRFFVEAVRNSDSADVRYKEVMDYISDSFSNNDQQTPLFVTQAAFTEIFLPVDDVIKGKVEAFLKGFKVPPPSSTKMKQLTILDFIKEDAKRYVSKENALELLEKVHQKISAISVFSGEGINEVFDISHSNNQSNSSMPQLTQAAEWLKKNNDHYFAKIYWDTHKVKRQVPKNEVFGSIHRVLGMTREYEMKEVDEEYCGDIINTTEIPYSNIVSRANRKFPNTNSCELFFLFFVSETKLAILHAMTRCKTTDWGSETSQRNMCKWSAKSFDITAEESIINHVDDCFKLFERFSVEPLIKWMDASKELDDSNAFNSTARTSLNPKK